MAYDDERDDKLVASADFDGPTRDRRCTDVLCLGLLFIMWGVMTGIGVYSVQEGDFRIVLYPLDYDGNICGTDFGSTDMTDYPNLYYINSFTGGVCVSECPTVSDKLASELDTNLTESPAIDLRTFVTYGGVWQTDGALLEEDFLQVGNYSGSEDVLFCSEDACFPDSDDVSASWSSSGVRKGFGYAYYAGDTYELLWRCYYTTEAERQIEEAVSDGSGGLAVVDDLTAAWNKIFADMYTARRYVLGFGFGLSTAISFVYIFLMRIPLLLDLMIWGSLLVTILLFFIGGYYSWKLAVDWDDADPQVVSDKTIKGTKFASVALYVIGVLVLVMTVCLRKQIQISIQSVKEAGRAINHMFLILLVPVLQAVGLLAFLIVFLYYAVHLASLGDITTKDIETSVNGGAEIAIRQYEFDDFVSYCGWYYLFCLYWTANFIVAVGDMIIALAVSHYYFAQNKMTIGSWTVIIASVQVLWYHAGTCAYGALLIATVQLIRTIIARMQRYAKKVQSKIAQAVLCCCQCFFCCMECCLKFINKNAYIQTAIFSTAFCKSARKAFFLIVRNAARIAALSYVSSAVLIVGKLFISAVTTLIGYYALVENLESELNSVGGPVAIIFLISYWISDFFMDVFDMAIATVLQCLIADEEMNNGRGVFADERLKSFVDKNAQENDEYDG